MASFLRTITPLRAALVAGIFLSGYLFWSGRSVSQPPGILAAEAPVQTRLETEEVLQHGELTVFKVARFSVTARVLSKERYWFGREARLVPYDLALGWGRMSDTSVLDEISISQRGRYYFWMTSDFPIPKKEIISSSANMHLIPANEEIRDAIGEVRSGQVVRFEGYLVRVAGPGGWRWTTSTTRTDTGNGACELVWVERFDRVESAG